MIVSGRTMDHEKLAGKLRDVNEAARLAAVERAERIAEDERNARKVRELGKTVSEAATVAETALKRIGGETSEKLTGEFRWRIEQTSPRVGLGQIEGAEDLHGRTHAFGELVVVYDTKETPANKGFGRRTQEPICRA